MGQKKATDLLAISARVAVISRLAVPTQFPVVSASDAVGSATVDGKWNTTSSLVCLNSSLPVGVIEDCVYSVYYWVSRLCL